MGKKIILVELNEVPFRVIDTFVRTNPRSTCAKILGRCRQFKTRAEDQVLSPWITWPTVHRGVTDREHGLKHFGQDTTKIDHTYPPLWKLLSGQGLNTGVFASLHTYPVPDHRNSYKFFVPDPFAGSPDAHPATISAFQAFSLAMSRESARNVSTKVPLGEALTLVSRIPQLGLRPRTLLAVAGQLAGERLDPWRRVRRRTWQSVLAFDVFLKQLRTHQPSFCTFFTNHVASSMHRYWAAAFPDDYERNNYDQSWRERFRGEIDFAMSRFDRFLDDLIPFVDQHPEYSLWIASSMGQAATTAQPVQTQLYLTNRSRFMTKMGVGPEDWSERPAMAPDVSMVVAPHRADTFRESVARLRIDDEPVDLDEKPGGFFSMTFGQVDLVNRATGVFLSGVLHPFSDLGFENVKIEDETNSNAYHVPEGTLLIYTPGGHPPRTERHELSTCEIAPSIIHNLGAAVPGYMRSPSPLLTL